MTRLSFRAQCCNCRAKAFQARQLQASAAVRHFRSLQGGDGRRDSGKNLANQKGSSEQEEPGPLARRLEEATEEALLTGGLSGRRAIEDAGFSDELKEKLLHKIADAKLKEQYSDSFAEAGMSSSASKVAQHSGSSRPWTGTETTEGAVLRILHDAKPPLKSQSRAKFQQPVVDTRIWRSVPQTHGQRAASARDKASMYVGMDMKTTKGLSDEEREEMKAQLRERFQPAARSVPVSISGLTALANQRIEDAISRGQFKDLPRGKEMERDPRSDSHFIDTTEYIMNKMIQRQEIVPPWIEKQQELTKAARVFRERLRNDWKRHAARMIASQGGTLEEQMRRAAAFADAELAHNPRYQHVGQVAVSSNATHHPVMRNTSKTAAADGVSISTKVSDGVGTVNVIQRPFRDSAWEQAELAYLNLSIQNLNNVTRSYNLMAPELAKKPYFSLERELNSCYADVAPLVANEIKLRTVGRKTAGKAAHLGTNSDSSLIDMFIGRDSVNIHVEENAKAYGLKEWWRDFWRKK